MNHDIHKKVEHLFRTESSRITARLIRLFGTQNIDLAENAVQEALISAMKTWPTQGMPDNPSGWLMQVAKNKAYDALRQNKFLLHDEKTIDKQFTENEEKLKNEFLDDELRLLFISCHPVLSPEVQVALALKTVCGFSVSEIARAFFTKDETIAQRLVRAKKKIAEANIEFELPKLTELKERLEMVLQAIYLLFNEGYSASSGDSLIRRDICFDAIRLTSLLMSHPVGHSSNVNALAALLCFQASRFDARTDELGDVVLLADQNRAKWDTSLIQKGFENLQRAMKGSALSSYHIEAGIAAAHASAASAEHTNWAQIAAYYEMLLQFKKHAVVLLNRAIAIAMAGDLTEGIRLVEELKSTPEFLTSSVFPGSLAELYRRASKPEMARSFYLQATQLAKTEPERRYFQKQIHLL